jgi:outer membrane lipoprotein SlyB
MQYPVIKLLTIFCLLQLTGCAATRPVLYPNGHLNTVGMEIANTDVDSCIALANGSGANQSEVSQTVKQTTEGAVVGGATGAAVGAVLGNAGQGAATGAAGAATGRFTRSILNSDKTDPVFQRFVNRCLRDKGYDVVGWN